MAEDVITVHCLEQEYWVLGRCQCSCGGPLSVSRQTLAEGLEGPRDILQTAYAVCGSPSEITFNVSSFLNENPAGRKSLLDESRAPMQRVVRYLQTLRGDDLALDYLQSIIDRLRIVPAQDQMIDGVCPHCGKRSDSFRFVESAISGRSYCICKLCGRSFQPGEAGP